MKRLLCYLSAALMLLCACAIAPTPAAPSEPAPAAPAPAEQPAPAEPQAPEPAPAPVELVVFAAASMTETMESVKELYANVAPHVSIMYNFDSSGTLKTQIQEGAVCDVFVSAGQKQMNQLDITASSDVNTEGLDFVLESSRLNLLENKVTLCVPDGNKAALTSFDDLAQRLKDGDILLSMGNADVPVGQYTQKILAFYGIDEAGIASKLTYGSNVKEVTTQVKEGSVDCGVVYCTDAFSAGLEIVDYATPEMCGQVIYPAAVLKGSANIDEAQKFLDYLSTPDAMRVFESVGFSGVD